MTTVLVAGAINPAMRALPGVTGRLPAARHACGGSAAATWRRMSRLPRAHLPTFAAHEGCERTVSRHMTGCPSTTTGGLDMSAHERALETVASPDRVWGIWSNAATWPQWN